MAVIESKSFSDSGIEVLIVDSDPTVSTISTFSNDDYVGGSLIAWKHSIGVNDLVSWYVLGPAKDVAIQLINRNNDSATVDPTASDDVTKGYTMFSKWINTTTDNIFICTNNTASGAVWRQV